MYLYLCLYLTIENDYRHFRNFFCFIDFYASHLRLLSFPSFLNSKLIVLFIGRSSRFGIRLRNIQLLLLTNQLRLQAFLYIWIQNLKFDIQLQKVEYILLQFREFVLHAFFCFYFWVFLAQILILTNPFSAVKLFLLDLLN